MTYRLQPRRVLNLFYLVTATFVCALLLAEAHTLQAHGENASPALKKVSFAPQWLPQAQFAGFMVAKDKGFYEQEGLDVEIHVGGPDKPPLDLVAAGEATFCTDWLSNAVSKRASGLRIVNLAQIVQRSALMLIARRTSGITRPADLEGKAVGLWVGHFYVAPKIFFRKFGLSVNIVPNYSSVSLFLENAVQAISAMYYNEYHTIINSGYDPEDLTVFLFRDAGLNFPEDGVYCLGDTFLSDPRSCRGFVDGSLRGWRYAFTHPEEALDIVMNHAKAAHHATNRAHQRWMLARMKEIIVPEGDYSHFGKLSVTEFTQVCEALKEFGFIKESPSFEEFYRGRR
jgi:NitT/TauT family transport system substrate-binding protein